MRYEFGIYEQCVYKAAGDRAVARKECLEALKERLVDVRNVTRCKQRGVVRATLGPPTKQKPTGALSIEAALPLAGGCEYEQTFAFKLSDVDRDGKDELEVHVGSTTAEQSFIRKEPHTTRLRHLLILRSDLRPQLSLTMAHTDANGETASDLVVHRHTLRDTDGDKHPDLELDTATYGSVFGCDEDDLGWPTLDPDVDIGECEGGVSQSVWRYDPTKDAWLKP